jgi:NAD(P)-dependent dehydrogenase (short-subunit alcohol dehydrogenase family)
VREFTGRVAAITGAGSGIGRALAKNLVRRGCHLALSDIDPVGLAETVRECEGAGIKVTADQVDVADRGSVYSWADRVVEDHGGVNLIFNNAGVALIASVQDLSYEDFEWLMNINFWGVVHGTKAFLPHLKRSAEGHVVNMSSVFGLVSVPSQSAYNSAKFAVRGFTDALRMELELEGSSVSATTIHPGGIKTNIARNARVAPGLDLKENDFAPSFEKLALTSARRAAQQILVAVERDRRRALIGLDAKVIDLISRGPIQTYQRVLVRSASRQLLRSKKVEGDTPS